MDEALGYIQLPSGTSLEEAKKFQERFNAFVAQSGVKFVPVRNTPPALFTPEMLEQIRTVIREEIDKQKTEPLRDTSIDEQEAFLKGQRKAV